MLARGRRRSHRCTQSAASSRVKWSGLADCNYPQPTMIDRLIYSLPLWALCLTILGVCVGYVTLSVQVTHRRGWILDPDEIGTATVLHAFVSVLYAVALA